MDCRHCRSAVSARLDGEPSGTPDDDVDRHLATCAGCRRFEDAASELRGRAASAGAEAHESRSADVLAAMAVARSRQSRWVTAVRVGLLAVAAVQLTLALPVLLLGEGFGVATHMARHLGAWDVALAIGFVVAAVQPVRVIGLLPLAAALAACMALAGVLDALAGGHSMVSELTHGLELTGVLLLWALSRRTPRPAGSRLAVWAPA
jgi:predicted anti-sigma-YlaC factor YlaD